MDKDRIIKNFSRYAAFYDKYANIQYCAGQKLLRLVNGFCFERPNILEIGCGTGNFTMLLRKCFTDADIFSFDISAQMVQLAKIKIKDGVNFFIADAEDKKLDFKDMDIVAANSSFQWLENLEQCLSRYKQMLKKNGLFIFSIFGKGTFFELDKILKLTNTNSRTASSCFLSKIELEQILKRVFITFYIEELNIKEMYPSFLELLKKIKYTGVQGDSRGFYWDKKKINYAEGIYKQHFEDITATYQIFLCKGLSQR
ncbi:hypothetical protein B9J78_05875 [bacterium Unc6]|nr:hypothetical protein [bacterium Unc6]